MNRFKRHIIPLFLLISAFGFAQISPGDLTTAHAKFEGMSNCTLCHDLGNKVTDAKCLDCHKNIKTLITEKRGFHVSIEVKDKNCFQCHNEHHGRKFEMIRFDEKKFNHDLTGYKLEGKHEEIDCKKCHNSDLISNKDFKKRPNTFLGLDNKCASCHTDYHQNTLSTNNCATCHNTEKFKPAIKFDHDKTKYQLKGKHVNVDCKQCHTTTKRNGKDFQNFAGIGFSDCKSCHDDPHNNHIEGACKQCHTETSFKLFKGLGQFNHNVTKFELKGSHKKVACFSCHTKTEDPKLVFQDKLNVDENNCISCHEDKHKGKFGKDCASCHNETSFIALKDINKFDHKLTDFPLVGMHQDVDCKKCHQTKKYTDPIKFNTCNSCHDDYHKGEFKTNGLTPDCKTCHSVQQPFTMTLFTTEQHQKSTFPLKGAHTATPCFSCHKTETQKRWTFKNISTTCVSCHQDIHKNFISQSYYPNQTCTTCHNSSTWADVNFDHSKTKWPLEGKHAETDCRNCHLGINKTGQIIHQNFKNLDSNCTNCHENKHGDEFAVNGITDCKTCHVSKSWFPEKFNHNTTAFPLKGKHAEIDCKACHKASANKNQTLLTFKIEKHQCIDCHR